jgi:hypothetical protein
MVLQSFVGGGNWSYLKLWVVADVPRYSGYQTPTVAPEPFVERVDEAVLSMGD